MLGKSVNYGTTDVQNIYPVFGSPFSDRARWLRRPKYEICVISEREELASCSFILVAFHLVVFPLFV